MPEAKTLNSKQQATLAKHLDTFGPGLVMEALSVFSDAKKFAQTTEGAAIFADMQADMKTESAKITTDAGKALMVRIDKLMSDAGLSKPTP